jgi:hypothetical protein
MSGTDGKFLPDHNVNRRLLAQVTHRGLPRISIDETIDDITT